MPFLTQGKTNWKYILILLVLAVIVGGGIVGYLKYFKREIESLTKFPEIKKSEKVVEEETANWKTYRNEEYGFEIKYPFDTRVVNEVNKPTPYFEMTTFLIVEIKNTIKHPLHDFPPTEINIYANKEERWIKNCLKKEVWNSEKQEFEEVELTEIQEINNIPFYIYVKDREEGAMGGKRALVDEYRIIHKNTCYRIESQVGWTSIEFVKGVTTGEPPTPEELREEKEWIQTQKKINNQILSTFRFLE